MTIQRITVHFTLRDSYTLDLDMQTPFSEDQLKDAVTTQLARRYTPAILTEARTVYIESYQPHQT